MLLKTVKKYWNKLEIENLDMCASFTLFRLLKNNNLKFKNINVLDVGFGEGQNLIELQKRGANIHGIELRKEKIKKIIKLSKVKKDNFYNCDLNVSFPKLQKKFDLIFSLDTFNYLTKPNQLNYFSNCYNYLKKDGFFLIHYPQMQLLKKMKKNIFDYEISKNNYKKSYFFGLENPIIFLKDKDINEIININKKKYKLISSIFDTNTISNKNSSKITINRYLLFKKN